MKIIKLDSSVYNKISAGEVVERPSSVVKELVENAIDAGATAVEISLVNAGLDEIKVLDNGSGIDEEDLKTAFLPHATSKIRSAEDLNEINTLGFRGEALPSIASVSMVEMRSKTQASEMGHFLKLRAGSVTEEGVTAMNRGTEITVSNLFFNTPARLKFLKTPSGELSEVKACVMKLIFANPRVAFRLSDEKGLIYSSDGKGLGEAIKGIFSEDIWQNLLPLDFEKSGIHVTGYASRSTFFKMNRTYQISVINGRVSENQSITSAISTVYQQYLMKRNYPVTVLIITIAPSELDVNVHPTKAEVRFSDGNKVFSAVYHAIKNAVEKDIEERKILFDTLQDDAEQVVERIPPITAEQDTFTASDHLIFDSAPRKEIPSFDFFTSHTEEMHEESEITRSVKEHLKKKYSFSEPEVQQEMQETASLYRVIGQVFGTYLLLEYNEKFIIVDQHAAVERLRYDKLLAAYEKGAISVQPLLIPHVLEVTPSEYAIVENKIDALRSLGIELVPFGADSFKLQSVPDILSDMDVSALIKYILSDRAESEDTIIRERLAYAACRSSIKGNTYLTDDQIAELMNVYFKQGLPVQCPHGRPAYYVYTKRDLEKLFKRIV
ncbi:MAG TPA: DNA mismatch repair endonuclease MutL [Clostridiales bacterium]|nr:DNA mismatch repair endonuclease MutL [Clostridiales bacterium]